MDEGGRWGNVDVILFLQEHDTENDEEWPCFWPSQNIERAAGKRQQEKASAG